MTSSQQERRRYKRVPVRIPVLIYASGVRDAVEAEVLDISEGGAFIHSTYHFKEGQNVLVEFKFAELELVRSKVTSAKTQVPAPEGKVEEKSVVRWIQKLQKDGFGIEFVELNPRARDFIKNLVKYCASV